MIIIPSSILENYEKWPDDMGAVVNMMSVWYRLNNNILSCAQRISLLFIVLIFLKSFYVPCFAFIFFFFDFHSVDSCAKHNHEMLLS